MDKQDLLDQIPVLHVRGTYRMVGFTIGRQFGSMIKDLLTNWEDFNSTILPMYETASGKAIYDETLALCRIRFPHYVEELEGMAEGSGIDFYKIFLLHIESTMVPESTACKEGAGCTSVICNNSNVRLRLQMLLGHTEDALLEFGNNVYVIAAEIIGENGERLEKFVTLTYPGHLPGYTMGFNSSFVYSVNTLFPIDVKAGRTPRTFLCRAILGASTFEEIKNILRDTGAGASDGFSLNIIFKNDTNNAYNVEVSPPREDEHESELSILSVPTGKTYAHCNKYLRLKIQEQPSTALYNDHRHIVLDRSLTNDTDLNGVKQILSDRTDAAYPIFRGRGTDDCPVRTVAIGIFDIPNRTWSIYMTPPLSTNPVAVLHLDFF